LDGIELTLLEGELAVARLDGGAVAPRWARPGTAGILSVTTTPAETSVVCDAAAVPEGSRASGGWVALAVAGPLEHSLTGVLASISTPLAEARVPIFAVSTFDTDYVLVPLDRREAAVEALRSAGHRVDVPARGTGR
jgi:uncharacterized protein